MEIMYEDMPQNLAEQYEIYKEKESKKAMAQMTMVQAINDALKTELKNDQDVLIFGEDVGVNGGVFRVTEGLQKNLVKIEYSIHL